MAVVSGRERLDQRLTKLPGAEAAARPRLGWLRAVRDALGMTTAQLAKRVGVTAAAVTQAEQSEQHDTVRLGTLRKFASAMDCDVVYYLVPRTGSLDSIVNTQVDRAAKELAARVGQTMALEAQQASTPAARQAFLREMVLLSGKIW